MVMMMMIEKITRKKKTKMMMTMTMIIGIEKVRVGLRDGMKKGKQTSYYEKMLYIFCIFMRQLSYIRN